MGYSIHRPGDTYEFVEHTSGTGKKMHVRKEGLVGPVCGQAGKFEAYCTGLPLCERCAYYLFEHDLPQAVVVEKTI